MTFTSTFVEKHRSKKKAMAPYCSSPVSHLKLKDSLRWGSLMGFADKRGLHVEYVDNCWIRVGVDSEQLRQFLAQAAGLNSDAQLITVVPSGSWFVINEEEF